MTAEATLTIGLTGGIASGKSTVAQEFMRLGADVIDADDVAREVVAPGEPALDEIVQLFSPEVLNDSGELDRAALRKRVFNDKQARRQLESIIHPRVRKRLEEAKNRSKAPYVILVVPLLAEGRLERMMDRILVVDVPEEVQIARLVQRDGIDRHLAERMLKAQASREQRLAIADDVFTNTGGLDSVSAVVRRLHNAYLKMSAEGPDSIQPLRLPEQ